MEASKPIEQLLRLRLRSEGMSPSDILKGLAHGIRAEYMGNPDAPAILEQIDFALFALAAKEQAQRQ